MGLFGKKPQEQTVVLLDIENGSVGSALVRLSPGKKPSLFGQTRVRTAVPGSRDASGLLQKIEKAAHDALVHAAEVAARIRHTSSTPKLGEISRAAVVLHAPWTRLEVAEGPKSRTSDDLLALFRTAIHDRLGVLPLNFHPFGAVAAHGARLLQPEENALVCTITGEVCEIISLQNGVIAGVATIPFGHHHLLRTLKTHAGLTEHEARTALGLNHAHEPLAAAAGEFGAQVGAALRELLEGDTRRIYVVGEESAATWAGRALSAHPAVAGLFPAGGEVKPLRPVHFSTFAHTPAGTDLSLLMGSLFLDSKLV